VALMFPRAIDSIHLQGGMAAFRQVMTI